MFDFLLLWDVIRFCFVGTFHQSAGNPSVSIKSILRQTFSAPPPPWFAEINSRWPAEIPSIDLPHTHWQISVIDDVIVDDRVWVAHLLCDIHGLSTSTSSFSSSHPEAITAIVQQALLQQLTAATSSIFTITLIGMLFEDVGKIWNVGLLQSEGMLRTGNP